MNPFTLKDLFSNNPYTNPEMGFECWECGVAVICKEKHVEWHNKIADL